MDPFLFLKMSNDFKNILGLWISLRAKHAHQAFRGFGGGCTKGIKTDCGVDIITQDSLSRIHVTD